MNTDKIYAEAIANEYAPKDTSKVVALRKIDRRAKSKANIFAHTFGVIMALVLGMGMCLSMKVIGNGSAFMMVVGVIVGVIGIIGVSVNIGYYIEGITAIIKEWVNNDCSDSAEAIATIIEECVRPANGIEGRIYGE